MCDIIVLLVNIVSLFCALQKFSLIYKFTLFLKNHARFQWYNFQPLRFIKVSILKIHILILLFLICIIDTVLLKETHKVTSSAHTVMCVCVYIILTQILTFSSADIDVYEVVFNFLFLYIVSILSPAPTSPKVFLFDFYWEKTASMKRMWFLSNLGRKSIL